MFLRKKTILAVLQLHWKEFWEQRYACSVWLDRDCMMKQLDNLTLLQIFGESILKHSTWLPAGYFMRSIASYQYATDQDTKPVLMLHLNWQHLAAAIMSPILHQQRNMIKPTKPSLQSPYGLLKETAGTRDTPAESGNKTHNFSDSITLIESAQYNRVQQKPTQSQEGYGVRVQELQGICIYM